MSVMVVGISVSLFIALMLVVVMRSATSGVPLILFMVMLIAAIVLAPVVVLSQRKTPEKRKRNRDAYALIDRLVEELDDDEIAYLRRRLEARESALPDDVAVPMEELLERRSEDRLAGKR